MLTREDIMFGYWRKYFFTMVEDRMIVRAWTKDDINRAVQVSQKPEITKALMLYQNEQVRLEAEAMAGRILDMSVDAMNRLGYTLDDVRAIYKS